MTDIAAGTRVWSSSPEHWGWGTYEEPHRTVDAWSWVLFDMMPAFALATPTADLAVGAAVCRNCGGGIVDVDGVWLHLHPAIHGGRDPGCMGHAVARARGVPEGEAADPRSATYTGGLVAAPA